MVQLTLTLKMTTAQVVETSVTVNNNSPSQDYVHPDDQTQPTLEYYSVLNEPFLSIFQPGEKREKSVTCHLRFVQRTTNYRAAVQVTFECQLISAVSSTFLLSGASLVFLALLYTTSSAPANHSNKARFANSPLI